MNCSDADVHDSHGTTAIRFVRHGEVHIAGGIVYVRLPRLLRR